MSKRRNRKKRNQQKATPSPVPISEPKASPEKEAKRPENNKKKDPSFWGVLLGSAIIMITFFTPIISGVMWLHGEGPITLLVDYLARKNLRNTYKVQLVAKIDEGRELEDCDSNIYGFCSSPTILLRHSASERIRELSVHTSGGWYENEIYKLSDGSYSLVGYVTETVKKDIETGKANCFWLFPELPFYDDKIEADYLVAIPVSKMIACEVSRYKDGHWGFGTSRDKLFITFK